MTAATFTAASSGAAALQLAIYTANLLREQAASGPFTLSPMRTIPSHSTTPFEGLDVAMLHFATATGTRIKLAVAAPAPAMFAADLETVIPGTLTNGITSKAIGLLSTRDGQVATTYIGGLRLMKRRPRRFTQFMTQPNDVGPGE